jgi:putative DNA primase/helicase
MFKALTGEDYISGEKMGKDPFYFRPYARMLFSCNEMPKNFADRSEGFYRRLLILRFDKSVPQDKRDPNLREKIACERDGILMWALDGLRRLIANSYIFSETERTRSEITRYKVESNSVLTFVDEYCVVGDGFVVREELYQKYKDFCQDGGMKKMAQPRFNAELSANFPEITRGQDKVSTRKVWRGIRFIDGGKE